MYRSLNRQWLNKVHGQRKNLMFVAPVLGKDLYIPKRCVELFQRYEYDGRSYLVL